MHNPLIPTNTRKTLPRLWNDTAKQITASKRCLHWQRLNLLRCALGRDRPVQIVFKFPTEVASKCFKSLNMCQCWNIPVVWMTPSVKHVASLPVQPVSGFYGDIRLENRCTGTALKTMTHNEKQLSPFSSEVMGSNTKQILLRHCQFTGRWPMMIIQPKQHCLKDFQPCHHHNSVRVATAKIREHLLEKCGSTEQFCWYWFEHFDHSIKFHHV